MAVVKLQLTAEVEPGSVVARLHSARERSALLQDRQLSLLHRLERLSNTLKLRSLALSSMVGSLKGPAAALRRASGPALHVAPPTPVDTAPLSPRQAEVARLVAEGRSNADIAQWLVLSRGTVANHVEHILVKLGFTSRTQIAVWAIERGIALPRKLSQLDEGGAARR